jgi:hypothetical protein
METFRELLEETTMSMSFRFRVALLAAALIPLAAGQPAGAKEPPVSGLFKGNGKEAKLAYVSATKGEPYLDKPTIVLVFTERDHSKEKNPKVMAGFGRFGSALIVTVDPDGQVIGCQVAHAAHQKSGFSAIGTVKTSDFKVAGGVVRGRLSTDGEVDTFGEKWEVNLTFQVKAP